MIDEEAKAILKRAFSALRADEIENFRWHLRNETTVLCGKPFGRLPYYDAEGAGCPAWLAASRLATIGWCRTFSGTVFERLVEAEPRYSDLSTNQETVLAAMYETVKEWDEESKK